MKKVTSWYFTLFFLIGLLSVQVTSQIPSGDVELVPAFGTGTNNGRFDKPIWIGENPAVPGMFLVLEQHNGLIYSIVENGGDWDRTQFMDVGNVSGANEAGLLSLDFHPDFLENGKYYYYVNPNNSTTEVREGVFSDDRLEDSGIEHKVIFTIPQPQSNHNGGTVMFSPDPADPYLYISLGDGGEQGDPNNRAQNTDNLLGKILRIDVDNPSGGEEYGIPSDNPYATGGGAPEIQSIGYRNPWKFSFDRMAPYHMWVGDVGQGEWEEISIIELGDNAGWRIREGAHCYNSNNCSTDGLKEPVTDYDHDAGRSVTGGYVYRGVESSEYYGAYFFADYGSRATWALTQENGVKTQEVETGNSPSGITSYGQDLAGNLYAIMRDNGTISRLDLGEIAVLDTTSRIKDTRQQVFTQLALNRNISGALEITLAADGTHKVELFKLDGSLSGSAHLTGKGTVSLNTENGLKGVHLLRWTRNDQVFTKRIGIY